MAIIEETLKAWRQNSFKSRVDIIGDYGGSELFVLDGDSLLQFLSTNPRYNYNLEEDIAPSPLLLIALIEKFIVDLQFRGGNFHIVFFESLKTAFANTDRKLFIREVVIRHLQNIPEVTLFRFASFHESEWSVYLDNNRPIFIMLAESATRTQTILWDALAYKSISRNLTVCYMTDLEFRDSKVIAFVGLSRFVVAGTIEVQEVDEYISQMMDTEQTVKDVVPSAYLDRKLRVALAMNSLKTGASDLNSQVFLLSVLLLSSLSIADRCLISKTSGVEAKVLEVLKHYYEASLPIVRSLKPESWDKDSFSDLVDERLYAVLVAKMSDKELSLDMFDVSDRFLAVLKTLGITSLIPVTSDYAKNLKRTVVSKSVKDEHSWRVGDLDLLATAFRDILQDIGSGKAAPATEVKKVVVLEVEEEDWEGNDGSDDWDADSDDAEEKVKETKIDEIKHESGVVPFREMTHWHSSRELHVVEEKKTSFWDLKNKQRYIAYVDSYARSLTGPVGLYGMPVIVGAKQQHERAKTAATKQKTNANPKAAKKVVSKKQQIIDENNARILKISLEKATRKMDVTKAALLKLDDPEKLAMLGETLVKVGQDADLVLICHWMKLQVLIKMFKRARATSQEATIEAAVDLFVEVKVCFESLKDLPQSHKYDLEKIGVLLGFDVKFQNEEEIIATIGSGMIDTEKGPGQVFKYQVGMPLKTFQLEYLGPSMSNTRVSLSKADPRVPFIPDQWQIDLLDCVDDGKSALVCAPTSSGKTFIAYYAMKKVLETNDTDIAIYVAPTKALVNQVAAEVYARFKKTYKTGQSVWGIWTRDYRHAAMKCQILITVPEMLGLLLLSPMHVDWTKKIKRVIFDEVHCIGLMDGGQIWENLLRSVQCPILCLSATIGNPKAFHSWLSTIQKSHGIDVEFIICGHRHSHLKKFVYSKGKEVGKFVTLHPWGSLNSNSTSKIGILKDGTLSSTECLKCYDAIVKVCGESKVLDPEMYFESKFLDRKNVLEYEVELRAFMEGLADKDASKFQGIVETLGKDVKEELEEVVVDPDYLDDKIFDVVMDLKAQRMLPAIMFSFDRNSCEEFAKIIYEKLVSLETAYRANDPVYQKKKAEAILELEKLESKKDASKRKVAKNDEDEASQMDSSSSGGVFDWTAADPKFCIRVNNQIPSNDEMKEIRDQCSRNMSETRGYLLEALERGVGVHHAGLPRKYLSAVERLMRAGSLTVVFGTGTLAFGINMPCRSTVFVGDSVFLTALMFRQMSGRAGRRGFDTLGNVVFMGVSEVKINRLMTADLPSLSGHFPLSTSLVLRICLYWSQLSAGKKDVGDLEFAERTVKGLLQNSLFSQDGDRFNDSLKHHLHFSLTYLHSIGLIDNQANLVDYSGIASHLFYEEPSNFAFTYLFNQGAIQKMCIGFHENQDDTIAALLNLLAHLFAHQFTHVGSKYSLAPLPESISKLLVKHNETSFRIYQDYCKRISGVKEESVELPLSKIAFQNTTRSAGLPISEYVSRSPFAALTGKGDEYATIADLGENVGSGIFIDTNAIPTFDLEISRSGRLNNYILAFYSHGQIKALVRDNGIREGDAWMKLKAFDMLLKVLVGSLEARIGEIRDGGGIVKKEDQCVYDALGALFTRFDEKFKKI